MTNGGWDFQVECVNLNDLGIDAGQRLGMVIVQPTYKVTPDGKIPFRISEEDREAQKALIKMAFEIRAEESKERNVPIPFVLFPETAIPAHGPDGLDFLRQQMEEVHEDVIFIGGLEGLSPEEVGEMVDKFPPAATLAFAGGTFVNICVIAVKSANGQLSWYFQAKLRPSKWEQPRNMAHGQRILYFSALQVAFLCQICFDHIAAQGEEQLNSVLCRQLIEIARPNAPTLDFVFVPQRNPQPNHDSMMKNTGFLLNYVDRGLKNDLATVVFVNMAASKQEPSEYGKSGFHYRANKWDIPTSDLGPKGYELYDSDHDITSAVFRKRTQAIHVATLVPPAHNVGKSENPRLPFENPRSYLIEEGCDPTQCSCLPGMTRGVGTFVECDCLPCKLRDALLADLPTKDKKKRWEGSDAGETQLLKQHYGEMRKDLLMLGCARTRELIHLLLLVHEDKHSNPDLWLDLQFEAVVELLAALSVLAEMQAVNYNAAPQWTAWFGENVAVALLDGADKMYSWCGMGVEYIRKYEAQYYRPEVRRIPVLLAALRSRGLVQPLVKLISTDFTKSTDPNKLGDEKSYARSAPMRIYVCQDTLFEGARQAEKITDFLKEEMRCILG